MIALAPGSQELAVLMVGLVVAAAMVDSGIDNGLTSGGDPDLGWPHLGVSLVPRQGQFGVGHFLTLKYQHFVANAISILRQNDAIY